MNTVDQAVVVPTALERTRGELKRFLVVGICTVAIDAVVYRALLLAEPPIWLAKAIGFLVGTLFAYFANKTFTFERAEGGRRRFALFYAVYGTTLLVNVGLNQLGVHLLGRSELALAAAFVAATGTSATLNFTGMKLVVFRPRETDAGAESGPSTQELQP